MRDCEIYSNLKVPCTSEILIRADGRGFNRLSRNLNLEKPYDKRFVKFMVGASLDFFQEFSPRFIYTFSDEINILLGDLPFSGRVEKLDSVFASFIASSFTNKIIGVLGTDTDNLKPISFDSRVLPLDKNGVVEYFKNRQDEAWRNCLNGYAYWTLREKMEKEEAMSVLNGMNGKEIHEMLFSRGLNINEVPTWQRRGLGLYKEEKAKKGYNPLKDEETETKRSSIIVDWDLPLFNMEFFQKHQIL